MKSFGKKYHYRAPNQSNNMENKETSEIIRELGNPELYMVYTSSEYLLSKLANLMNKKPKCSNCWDKGFASITYGQSTKVSVYKKFCKCAKGKAMAQNQKQLKVIGRGKGEQGEDSVTVLI